LLGGSVSSSSVFIATFLNFTPMWTHRFT